MARVLVAGRIHADGMAVLAAAGGLEIEVIADPGARLPAASLAAADALLIRYGVLGVADLETMPRLKVVARHGVGVDNLPVAALSARGIPVATVGPVNAVSVAEQVMAFLLALARKTLAHDRAVRGGDWAMREAVAGVELAGRRLMLLGLGRIGREVARRALAFDMEVLAFDPALEARDIRALGCTPLADWRAALGTVDALSLHLPLTAATRNLIGAAELAAMKPAAWLINAARGGIVEEAALAAALAGRMRQGGAGLDCFAAEPPAADDPLLKLPNVVLSPHSAALTAEAARRMGVVAAGNVVAGLAGRLDPALVVNLRQLEEAGHGG